MENDKIIEFEKKGFWNFFAFTFAIMCVLVQFATGLVLVTLAIAVVLALYTLTIFIVLLKHKKLNIHLVISPLILVIGEFLFFVIFGADPFGTRLMRNILIAAPVCLILILLAFVIVRLNRKKQFAASVVLTAMLMVFTSVYILTMDMRAVPRIPSMIKGHDAYLSALKDENPSEKPNVLFILADDMGYADISAYGYSNINTPNIDRIAASGVLLENFYAASPVCSPSRFSALTGRYAARGFVDKVVFPSCVTFDPFNAGRLYNSFELLNNVEGIPGDEISFSDALDAVGYNTGLFGKWNLGDYGQYLPKNHGFDHFFGSYYVNDMNPYEFYRNDELVYPAPFDQSRVTGLLTDEIVQYVNKSNDENTPFLAYYTTPWPHSPIYASEEWQGHSNAGTYGDCIEELDNSIGIILDQLEVNGQLDNTIIIVSSDNGPGKEGANGALRGRKNTCYEGGQKVPFIISYPKMFEEGIRNKTARATMLDIYPTLMDIMDLSLPTDRIIDGKSMVDVLQGKSESTFTEFYYLNKKKVLAVQKDGYKYFESVRSDNSAFIDQVHKNYLFNLTNDPAEAYVLTKNEPEMAAEMKQILRDFRKELAKNRRGIIE